MTKLKPKKRPKVTTWRGWGVIEPVRSKGIYGEPKRRFLATYCKDLAFEHARVDGVPLVRVVATCTEVKP